MSTTAAIAHLIGANARDFTGIASTTTAFVDECDECNHTALVHIEAEHTHRRGNWTETLAYCLDHAAEAIWALDMADAASITVTVPAMLLTPTALAA
ncbi:hypothetical protein ACFWU5_16550 [Nocardia sp. NPDC058640]|uniref:hypothetical protein n=1 Tax=Nocardia sp. NPDC058640 TaxID=3346571 RepID=UPI00364FE7EF